MEIGTIGGLGWRCVELVAHTQTGMNTDMGILTCKYLDTCMTEIVLTL